ncbi:MAG TPA: hypothetical protein VD794_09615, partial [Flavisolibacter sp.]|nr:hypothetical protein [Flavisolibacter sp.]
MRKLTFSVTALMFTLYGLAQNNSESNSLSPKVLPPSPEATNITKGGDFNVGLFTGTAQFSIPLYTIKYRDVNFPISLNYSSNGVKVNDYPSRVGLGWNLNGLGVITKTIMDEDDDNEPLMPPPVDAYNQNSLAEYVFPVYQMQSGAYKNTQPDEFSFNFNGYAGKFYFNHLGELKKVEANSLKIERHPLLENSAWNFKITDPKGVVYYFGGGNSREKTKSIVSGASNWFNSYKYTSWYLSKIYYPNGDSLIIEYNPIIYYNDIDVSQELKVGSYTCSQGSSGTVYYQPNDFTIRTAKTGLFTEGVIINKIVSSDGTQVQFYSSLRPDHYSDKKLDSLVVINQFGRGIKHFNLVYDNVTSYGYTNDYYNNSIPFGYHRIYLKKLIEKGQNDSLTYTFDYHNPAELAPRFSFAQDHLGYFNGQQNSTLLPRLPLLANGYSMSDEAADWNLYNITKSFGANREPNLEFARMGSLKSITYPTGGKTEIVWELNTVYKNVTVDPPATYITISGIGSGPKGIVTTTSSPLNLQFEQVVNIGGSTEESGEGLPVVEYSHYKLRNVNTNTIVYSRNMPLEEQYSEDILLSPGTYQLEVDAYGSGIRGTATLFYKPGIRSYAWKNVPMPGLRVKAMKESDGLGNTLSKSYLYRESIDSLHKSSGVLLGANYQRDYATAIFCNNGVEDPAFPTSTKNDVTYKQLLSSNLFSNYIAQSNFIYKTVIESTDTLLSQGATEHRYKIVSYDMPAQQVFGNRIPSTPFSNLSFLNGREEQQTVYKRRESGLIPIRKVVNHYSFDNTYTKWDPQYIINMRYQLPISSLKYGYPNTLILDQFDIAAYDRIRNWVKLDSTVELTYDDNGQVMRSATYNQYNNSINYLPTQIQTTNSKGEVVAKRYRYINDFISESPVYNNMLARNIVDAVIEEKSEKQGLPLTTKKTVMGEFSGLYLPWQVQTQAKAAPLETRVEFTAYDSNGNPLEMQLTGRQKKAYLWDYLNTVPIAEAINASQQAIAYTSFEADGTGGWTWNGTILNQGLTGGRALNGTLTKTVPAGNYIVSLWSQ